MLPYKLEGSGPPLLLIHGWGVTYNVWNHLVPMLKPHFLLILVELPGFGAAGDLVLGESYYPACAAILDELRVSLGIEQWAIWPIRRVRGWASPTCRDIRSTSHASFSFAQFTCARRGSAHCNLKNGWKRSGQGCQTGFYQTGGSTASCSPSASTCVAVIAPTSG